MRKDRYRDRPKFPRGTFRPLPASEPPQAATARFRREKKLLADDALREREFRRVAEVQNAFYEGMNAGNDAWWHERSPDYYWLSSDARRGLYAGPPLPPTPEARARLNRHLPGYTYVPERDPERVWNGEE